MKQSARNPEFVSLVEQHRRLGKGARTIARDLGTTETKVYYIIKHKLIDDPYLRVSFDEDHELWLDQRVVVDDAEHFHWTLSTINGYPRFSRRNDKGKFTTSPVGRAVWARENNTTLDRGQIVQSKCGFQFCVNPEHLKCVRRFNLRETEVDKQTEIC